jgi:hypothetical protein
MKTALVIVIAVVVLVAASLLAMRRKQQSSGGPHTSVESQGGTFSVAQGEVDGHRLIVIIDTKLRDVTARQRLPFFLGLSSPLIGPNSEGLPSRSDASGLNEWEDAVEARLRSATRVAFVGRVKWNGNRELLYYVDTPKPAVEILQTLENAHSTRPFAFVCERDERWTKADFWLNRH